MYYFIQFYVSFFDIMRYRSEKYYLFSKRIEIRVFHSSSIYYNDFEH